MFIVAACEILHGTHALDGMAELVDIVVPAAEGGDHDAEDAAFPVVVEGRFVRLGVDGSEPVHAAEIVHAVHDAAPCAGSCTLAVPIMESRETRFASCSSVQLWVPAGRCGSTR